MDEFTRISELKDVCYRIGMEAARLNMVHDARFQNNSLNIAYDNGYIVGQWYRL